MQKEVTGFDDIAGMDAENEKQRIGTYQVSYVPQVSSDGIESKYTRVMVFKDGKWSPAGEVSNASPRISYTEGIDWVLTGLKDLGYSYKLVKSVVNYKRFDLYQVYAIDNWCIPDGIYASITPCVVVRMSYSRMPILTVCFSVYQYNDDFVFISVMRGKCVVTATRYTWQGMKDEGFGATIKRWISNYTSEIKFFQHLFCLPVSTAADAFCNDMVPTYVRKKALGILEQRGLKLNDELPLADGMRYKLLNDAAFHKYRGDIIKGGEQRFTDTSLEITAWDALQTLARVASGLSTPSRILAAGRAVDRVFYEMEEASYGDYI